MLFPLHQALIMNRMLPVVQTLKTLVRGGSLGTILRVKAHCLLNLKTNPKTPFSWWFDQDAGGGALGGVGVHLYDLVSFITGAVARTVSCVGSNVCKRRPLAAPTAAAGAGGDRGAGAGAGAGKARGGSAPVTADELFSAQLLLQREITVLLEGSFVHPFPGQRLVGCLVRCS